MASVFMKPNGKLAIRFKDETGKWRSKVTDLRSKVAAKRLAHEVERRCERVRLGLEPRLDLGADLTVGDVVSWWLENHSVRMRSHKSNCGTLEKQLMSTTLASRPANRVTTGEVVRFLDGKRSGLAPKTINNLRGLLHAVYEAAIEAEMVACRNPVKGVKRQRVPKRVYEFLRPAEAAAVLEALPAQWTPLFATAIYQGLRKGELFALRKADVDLAARLLTVRASHDATTTKGGHADVIPIAEDCVPFLRSAIEASPSELVFPRPDGRRRSKDTKLGTVLRRAMGKAGVVEGYEHRCWRKRCKHALFSDGDDAVRECPKCGFNLRAIPIPKKVRFHDLRHTTASLLTMAGANPAAVQKILRHTDVRTTTETYTHLTADYLRADIDRLRLPPLVTTLSPTSARSKPKAVGLVV